MLWQAYLHDIVRSSLGLVAAEVWTDVDRGAGVLLQRAAYFIDPAFEEIETATNRLGRFSAAKCAPGVGLAGVMWSRAAGRGETLRMVALSTIAKDEDLPADQRTADLADTFDLVAAARLEPDGRTDVDGGLLILYARESARQVFVHPANLDFLNAAVTSGAQLVAAATARATLQAAKRNRSAAWAKVRRLLKSGFFLDAVRKEAERLESGEATITEAPPKKTCVAPLLVWLRGYLRKFLGVPGAKAPALKPLRSRAAWVTYVWTWLGVFLTLLTLSGLSALVSVASDERYFLMLGSFGALMALQFGAPNSPLAQPRNAIFGCTVASSVSILTYYLSGPDFLNIVPTSVALAIAPATAIATTQRLNLLHPPAGAAALIFITAGPKITSLSWLYLFVPLLGGNIVCCCMAMLVNNASRERQYPVFW